MHKLTFMIVFFQLLLLLFSIWNNYEVQCATRQHTTICYEQKSTQTNRDNANKIL